MPSVFDCLVVQMSSHQMGAWKQTTFFLVFKKGANMGGGRGIGLAKFNFHLAWIVHKYFLEKTQNKKARGVGETAPNFSQILPTNGLNFIRMSPQYLWFWNIGRRGGGTVPSLPPSRPSSCVTASFYHVSHFCAGSTYPSWRTCPLSTSTSRGMLRSACRRRRGASSAMTTHGRLSTMLWSPRGTSSAWRMPGSASQAPTRLVSVIHKVYRHRSRVKDQSTRGVGKGDKKIARLGARDLCQ